MHYKQFLITTLLLMGVMPAAHTESVKGKVTQVVDGDTITVNGESVRLQGVDAPESDQPYGSQSTAALRSVLLNRAVRLDVRGRDRYDRVIAVIYLDERNLNRWLVYRGHAWEYDKYSEDPALGRLEEQARAAERGIWSGENPTPPWQWRRRSSDGSSATRDRDCSDFESQYAAQQFFNRHQPGDTHRLDGNGDGVACESLP